MAEMAYIFLKMYDTSNTLKIDVSAICNHYKVNIYEGSDVYGWCT